MNVKRFYGLPNALKPVIIVLVILTMILGGAGPVKDLPGGKTPSLGGGWFFWLTMIVQLVWMVAVIGLFLYECEPMLTCGREAWPIVVRFVAEIILWRNGLSIVRLRFQEMSYSGAFCVCNVVNTFILASWYKHGANGTFIVAAVSRFPVTHSSMRTLL